MMFVIDMNLSPVWCEVLKEQRWEAVHWSSIGEADAADEDIMKWARENSAIVFTHDLDFSEMLAVTNRAGPSVLQIRHDNPVPAIMGLTATTAIKEHERELTEGAIVVVQPWRSRVRLLPLRETPDA